MSPLPGTRPYVLARVLKVHLTSQKDPLLFQGILSLDFLYSYQFSYSFIFFWRNYGIVVVILFTEYENIVLKSVHKDGILTLKNVSNQQLTQVQNVGRRRRVPSSGTYNGLTMTTMTMVILHCEYFSLFCAFTMINIRTKIYLYLILKLLKYFYFYC